MTTTTGWNSAYNSANGQLLIGNGTRPIAANLTAGTGVTVTNGAGTITLATAATVAGSYTTDSGSAVPAANVLSVLGGPGITTSGAGSTITISGVTWSEQAGNFTAAVDNGYFCSAALVVTLPAAPSIGETVFIDVVTASTVTITANAGQQIRLGSTVSAVAGTCASTAIGDSIMLVYRATGTTWQTVGSPTGTWVVT